MQWLFYLMINREQKSKSKKKHIKDTIGWLTASPIFSKRLTFGCRIQSACGSMSYLALKGSVSTGTWRGVERTECENSCVQRKEHADGMQTQRACCCISNCPPYKWEYCGHCIWYWAGLKTVLDRLNISHFGTAAVEAYTLLIRAAEVHIWPFKSAGTLSRNCYLLFGFDEDYMTFGLLCINPVECLRFSLLDRIPLKEVCRLGDKFCWH